MLSHIWFSVAPRTVAHQVPLSMKFSGKEYQSGLPCPPAEDLPNPAIELRSSTLQADSLPFEQPGIPRMLVLVAYPFSRGSSQPRNQTRVSCIVGRFVISWATREDSVCMCVCVCVYLWPNETLSMSFLYCYIFLKLFNFY